jgi:crotonobetainyl-CoA:carnitine CoA-transferase CaiB-like acyl-CoA transferase
VFLMATHMMQAIVTGQPAKPMPSRISAWGIYDVFTVAHDEQIFLAVVSNTQWQTFCDVFNLPELRDDARLASNIGRVEARDWLMPLLRERLARHSAGEIATLFEQAGLPYAPITRPHELFDDAHLRANGSLAPIHIAPDCSTADAHIDTVTPLLPFTLGGARPAIRSSAPMLGEHSTDILHALGYRDDDIVQLTREGVVGVNTEK